jgi:transcriptional regulator GlxA family with amidase domain
MTASGKQKTISVSLLAVPESTPATLYGLFEVFVSVGVTWAELTGEQTDTIRFEPRIVSATRETFASAYGVPIAPHAALADVERTDVIVTGDVYLDPHSTPHGRWPEATAWLRDQFAKGATVCSVCTGAVLLAESGLLDGAKATTHWSAAELIRARYPSVELRPERVLVQSGPDDRIITTGGVASWEDLALYLVARFSGEAEAVRIAKIFLFGDRSEGQLPFAAMTKARRHDDAVVAGCQTWIADHYASDNPVSRMIDHSGLPARTFKRRFRTATGYAPVDYVQTLRIEEAKQILETTSEPTDSVAEMVGYGDPTFFRRLFKRKAGVTPARYRQRFQSIARPDH